MRTVDITFTSSEVYTVCNILNRYIEDCKKKENDKSLTEAHRDCCHECAVEVSRIKNRMFDKVHRW